jgi:hypothetical protein
MSLNPITLTAVTQLIAEKKLGSGLGYCDLGSSIKKLAISIKTEMGR